MRPYVGLVDPRTLLEIDPEGFDAVLAAGIFAPQPMMGEEEWHDFEGGKVAALIGSFPPSLVPAGASVHWKDGKFRTILAPLNRVTDVLPVDLTGNGRQDLVVCEYADNPYKSYHGIRLHLNDGNNGFNEVFFHHMPGAYKAIARDFDGNGHLDIASISYFPNFAHNPRSGFVLLRQGGPLQFTAYNLDLPAGRWLTMDAGDIDGDGRLDIVLAAHNYGPELQTVPPQIHDLWERRPVPLLLLKNKSR